MRYVFWVALFSLFGCGDGGDDSAGESPAPLFKEALLDRGLAVYRQECARCHGPEGRGDGPEAPFLYPLPRNFARGHFRITSTEYGLPTDVDLLESIRDGLPGSAMPPFPGLSEEDQAALVAAVKHLAVEGKVDELITGARERGESMARSEALELVRGLFAPGPPVPVPPEVPVSEASVERGEELYEQMCSSCHSPDAGRRKRDMIDDSGAFLYPRDLDGALLLRDSRADLARTIKRGLPGTPMPAYELPAEELWALVHYVETLLPDRPSTPRTERTIRLTGVADPGVWTLDTIELGYQGTASARPARIVLREGEQVTLLLESADVTHSFYSPELGLGPVPVYPGRPQTLRFQAPAPGEYEYFCTSLCGHCHFSMKGSILVIPAGAEAVAEELAASCEDVFGIPGDLSVVAKGETLYGKMDCGECHGESGRGGVENFNALPAEKVPSLDGYAESVMFWGPGEKDLGAAIQLLAEKVSLHSLASNPPFPNYDVFLRQYDAYRTIMLEGRFTPRKDPDGPEPPLQMPAWQARLTPDEIDALFAYLLSLSRGVRPEPITQPLSFNHALHVVDAGLVCLDCHQGVSASPLAGLPAKVVCQDCHFPEDAEGESVSRDLVTLIGYFGQEREIPWSRVYRLPDEVRFSHVRHLEGGSLRCEQCHGEVSQLTSPPEMPFYRMRMSWCLDCHRQRQATQDCRACHL